MEDKSFHDYHASLGVSPGFTSARAYRHTISILANYVRKQIDSKLKILKAFSITTDAWTDQLLRKYIAITFHAIDPETFKLFSFPRDVLFIPENHTWYHVTNKIAEAIHAHTSNSANLSCVVTDNGSNFVKMSVALMRDLDVAAIEGIGEDDWEAPANDIADFETSGWRCVAHTMQLAVLDVLDTNKGSAPDNWRAVITNVRGVCTTVRVSANLRNQLKDVQACKSRPNKIPKVDCPTRWSTLFYMLQRFDVIYEDLRNLALLGAFDDRSSDWTFPLHADMHKVRALVIALEPMEKFIRLLEGEKYITISNVPKRLYDCMSTLHGLVNNAEGLPVTRLLLESLDQRLGFILKEVNLSLVAAALDPRYGDLRRYVHFNNGIVNEGLIDSVWNAVANWANEYNQLEPVIEMNPRFPSFSNNSLTNLTSTVLKIREHHENNHDTIHNEDPLQYWKSMFDNFILTQPLSNLLLCILCIPATSAPSERVFSKGRLILPRLRAHLNPACVEDLFLISEWSKSEHFVLDELLNEFVYWLEFTPQHDS